MNLHEYQAKQIFSEYGLPVSQGKVATTAEQAEQAAEQIGGKKWVVKAQVHAGGRGKVGGVKLVDSPGEAADFAQKMLGRRLVTIQTDENGQPINHILVETCTDIDREIYLSILVDRDSDRIAVLASPAGGMDIEKVAAQTPEKIRKVLIQPVIGPQPFQARELGFHCGFTPDQIKQFVPMFMNLVRLFIDKDLSLLEVNPLVVTASGDLLCLDAKINLDDNALYRHKDMLQLRDTAQEDERENLAAQHQLSYVALDGNIGCMVNGAGLAMATMDTIKTYGGFPANFLDVGGGATKERVSEAFKIILSDSQVKGVLVNIFGGIVRCDLIAEGVLAAIEEVGVNVPVVVRLEGNNAESGMALLEKSALKVLAASGMAAAAHKVVEVVNAS